MIWPKPSCASPFNFDRVLTARRKVVHRISGPTAPPVADRSSQAASDSDAALRQHIQNNDIASSDPRLVKNAPFGASVGDAPNGASRYALRASRSVVVSLSLSRRNAASESEERARDSWFVARKSLPLYSDGL